MIRRNTCRVCLHPEAAAIDRALRAGEPRRAVMRRYGLPAWSTRWHWRYHVVARFGGTDLEREARAFALDLTRLCREAEAELREAERRGRLGKYRRAWTRLRVYVQLRALSLGIEPRLPERAALPAGRPRGGRLKHGKILAPPDPRLAAQSTPADPLAHFRRARVEQLRRLGITDD